MTPEVQEAIEEIKAAFSGCSIVVIPEPQGGAYVVVHDLFIGKQYIPETSWVGFLIGFQYPQSDVYPHFIEIGIKRNDNQSLGEGMTSGHSWQACQAIQVSRRSNHWNAATDTAALKLAKVLEWIRTR